MPTTPPLVSAAATWLVVGSSLRKRLAAAAPIALLGQSAFALGKGANNDEPVLSIQIELHSALKSMARCLAAIGGEDQIVGARLVVESL
jgi:hypothetical protein